ncbi:MAG: hydroxymethylbilane synthase [Marinilabiliaceae bacterium]
MSDKTIRIGTRKSDLAMWQAREVSEALTRAFPGLNVEIVKISTKGDAVLDVALSKIGDKGLFTREIEQALIEGRIDMAVHSLKDLPTALPEGLVVGGVLPRGEVRDVLISNRGFSLEEMPDGARVGTSSLRRQAQLLHFNPGLEVVDIRGNVNTRLRKMKEGHCDALLMAGAGILRLGLDDEISGFVDPSVILPAVSQGAVAVEIRGNDPEIEAFLKDINDASTWKCTMAERAFLRTIEGGCQVPVGCYSEMSDSTIRLTGMVASVDGKKLLRESVEGDLENAETMASGLAESLLLQGGKEILDQIR